MKQSVALSSVVLCLLATLIAVPAAAYQPSASNPYRFNGTYSCVECGIYDHYKMGDGNWHQPGCNQSGAPLYWCDCSIGYAGSEMLQKPVLTVTSNGSGGWNLDVEYYARNIYCNPPADFGDIHEPNAISYRIQVVKINATTLASQGVVYTIPPYWEHGKVTIPNVDAGCSIYRAVYVVQNAFGQTFAVSSDATSPMGNNANGRPCLRDDSCPIRRPGGSNFGPGGPQPPQSGTSPNVGRPINVGSGDMQYTEKLFDVSQPAGSLPFEITYNSRETTVGPLGLGFTHTFAESMRPTSGTTAVRAWRGPSGQLVLFARENHPPTGEIWRPIWPGDAVGRTTFSSAADTYTYKDLDGTSVAVRNRGGTHLWDSTTDRWGNRISGTYTGNTLTQITDAVGRVWNLVYSGTLLMSITDGDGNQWRFTYDGSNRLSAIYDPLHTGTTPWRRFTWVGSPGLLALVSDEADAVLEGHQYDTSLRAISSWVGDTLPGATPAPGPNARELVTLVYDSPTQTTVTSNVAPGVNQVTVYTLARGAGRFLATSILGNCASCGTSVDAQTFTFDNDNHPLTRTVGIDRTGSGGTDERVTSSFTYNADGLLLTATDAVGTPEQHTTTYAYANANWPNLVTTASEESVAKPAASKTTTTAWNTGETVLTTTATGYLTPSDPSPTTYTTTTTFDARHRPTNISGPAPNQRTTHAYYADSDATLNRRGRVQESRVYTSATAFLSTTHDDYDVFGTPRTTVDPNGVRTERILDARGRVTSVTSVQPPADPNEPANYTSTFAFDGRDRMTSTTSARGNGMRYRHEDGTNRTLETIRVDFTGNERERLIVTLNALGDKLTEAAEECTSPANPCTSWVARRTETYTYGASGRLASVVHPDATTMTYAYDSRGNVTAQKDERHVDPNTLYAYDPLDRLKQVTQTLAGSPPIVTVYAYDDGNLVSVTDPNGNTTTYAFDDFSRMQKQISPVSGTTTSTYDAAGNLLTSTDANGATTTNTYDAANRILTATSTRGSASESVTWTYDDPTAGRYALGRLASLTEPTGSTEYHYERRGLPRYETRTIEGSAYSTSYGYDANGNRSIIGYPSSRVVGYTFDFADRPASASSAGMTYVASASYLPFGPEKQRVYGNGTTQDRTFDQRYRIDTNQLTGPLGSIVHHDYTVDGAGNVTAIDDLLDASYNRSFGYDDLHRLTSANTGTALWGTGSYGYDAMGNLLSLSLGSARNATFNYLGTLPSLTSVVENGDSRAVSYDSAGNETGVGTQVYSYSPRNRLASSGGFTYVYDARGVRAVSTVPLPSLDALSIDDTLLEANASSAGTVTLNRAAPAGGVTVLLTSSQPSALTVPTSVVVPQGAVSASFTATASPVSAPVTATVTATLGESRNATVDVVPTVASSLSVNPPAVTAPETSIGTVTLSGVVPAGGSLVTLTSSDPAIAAVPPNVTVPEGSLSQTFTITTAAPPSPPATLTITAANGGESRMATLQVGACSTPAVPPPGSVPPQDEVWIDDALPPGATVTEGTIVWDPTQAATGTQSFRMPFTTGLGTQTMRIDGFSQFLKITGGKVVLYVLMDPCAPAREIKITYSTGHRTTAVYWGTNLIPQQLYDPVKFYRGALPPAGQWARLEVPLASPLRMEGQTMQWMKIQHFDGRVWFDHVGTNGLGCTPTVATPPSSLPSGDRAWFDDDFPAGTMVTGGYAWDSVQHASGTRSLTSPYFGQNVFNAWRVLYLSEPVNAGDHLIVYVQFNDCVPVRELMLTWFTDTLQKAVYWGESLIGGESSAVFMGASLPPASGAWVRIEIPAGTLGLEGTTITSFRMQSYAGQTWLDRVGAAPGGSASLTPQPSGNAVSRLLARLGSSWRRRRQPEVPPVTMSITAGRIDSDAPGDPRRYSFYTPELNLLAETSVSTAATPPIAYEYVWFAGEPVAQIATATSETAWTFTDHLGTPLVQTDSTAAVVWHADYEPYGEIHAYRAGVTRHQPLRLPGQERDPEGPADGTSYNVFRWYRAGWGRYTQADPIGMQGGFNLFAYALDNPITYDDPFGLKVRMCCRLIPHLRGARHCFFQFEKSPDNRPLALHGTRNAGGYLRAIIGKDTGQVLTNDPFDQGYDKSDVCGPWAEDPCNDVDGCVRKEGKNYPNPSGYSLLGPNSNTFAHQVARKCFVKPAHPVNAPGWNSPPASPK